MIVLRISYDGGGLCSPCVSVFIVQFLPRDATRERGLRPVSVRQSRTLVYCIQKAEDIFKRLSRPSSPIILVFDPNAGTPFSGGVM